MGIGTAAGRLAGAAGHPFVKVGGGAAALVVAVLATHFFWTVNNEVLRTKLLPPDTPPAEYLYLDTQRVLAYLGQIEGGLTDREKRIASLTEAATASVNPGLLGDVGASRESRTSVEQVVTPAATDRFFTLLIKLRSGRERTNGRDVPWLKNVDLELDKRNSATAVRKTLRSLQIGDFVRLSHARLLLSAYAAVAPKVRYAVRIPGTRAAKRSGRPKPRADASPSVVTPVSQRQQAVVDAYLRRLGADPPLPFVARTRPSRVGESRFPTFFVPAGYAGLLDNDRLLASDLTVVGKVIYEDLRGLEGEGCDGIGRPCTYVDRQTIASFAPSLRKTPARVLSQLGIDPRRVLGSVRRSVTFSAPVVVVLPLAIYQ